MTRPQQRLTDELVATLPKGRHSDGGCLSLEVKASGSASWIFRFWPDGVCRHVGLGPARGFGAISVAEARERREAILRDPSSAPRRPLGLEARGLKDTAWRKSEDAVLAPFVTGVMTAAALEQVAASLNRSFAGARSRVIKLRSELPDHVPRAAQHHFKERSVQSLPDSRKCSNCQQHFKPKSRYFFRCDACKRWESS